MNNENEFLDDDLADKTPVKYNGPRTSVKRLFGILILAAMTFGGILLGVSLTIKGCQPKTEVPSSVEMQERGEPDESLGAAGR